MDRKKRQIWILCFILLLILNIWLMITGHIRSILLHYISTTAVAFTLGMYIGEIPSNHN